MALVRAALGPGRASARGLATAAGAAAAGDKRKVKLVFAAGCVPKAEGTRGEDAYFASSPLASFALADGVGGWTREGVDAGLFSRALLRHVHGKLKQRAAGMATRPDLPGAAVAAIEAVRREKWKGSTTLLMGQLHQDQLTLLSLGDCGVIALRPTVRQSRFLGGTPTTVMRRLYRSTPMLFRANFPYQLSSEDRNAMETLEPYDLTSVRLRKGDIIIAGTDGLFDNVGDRELESIARAHHDEGKSEMPLATVQALAESIIKRAADSARAPIELAGGGKLDDIAVIVAQAQAWTPGVSGGILENIDIGADHETPAEAAERQAAAPAEPQASRSRPAARPAMSGLGLPPPLPRAGSQLRAFGSSARRQALQKGATVHYSTEGAAERVEVEATVGDHLGTGTYASAWELLPADSGPKAVLKCFLKPDPALRALYGVRALEETREQWRREQRAGELVRWGPQRHAGHGHVAHLLCASPRVAEEYEVDCDRMLVFEHAGKVLESSAAHGPLGFEDRADVIGQLLDAVQLLRRHGETLRA